MATSDAPESQNHALIILFDAFALVGFCLLLCAFLPAVLSKAVKRSIAWYNFMAAWLLYSACYGILVGRQEGPDPPLNVCLAQTVLVYATPPLVSTATLCFYIEFFLVIYRLRSSTASQPSSTRMARVWLVITPWIVFSAIIIVVSLFIFLGHRLSEVQRKDIGFYCHVTDGTPNIISASVVVAGMAVLLSLEGYTGYLMRKNWNVFKMLSKNDREIFITLYVRLILCTIAAVFAFVLGTLLLAPAKSHDLPTLVYPSLSIIIAFAFGTQKDILRAWLFWRSPKPYGSIIFNNGTRNDTMIMSTSGAIQTSSGEIMTTFPEGSTSSSQSGHGRIGMKNV